MNIVITGASRGIGYYTALRMASMEGNKIYAISRNKAGLEELSSRANLNKPQHALHFLPFDLTAGRIETGLVPDILKVMPAIDILINNAGELINKPFLELEEQDYNRIFDVNIKSVILLIRALAPYFNRGGHIVNIGSMGGFQGSSKFKGLSLYSASKAALACLSECLAVEFMERGIRVNCLALGASDTEMFRDAFPGHLAPVSAGEMAAFISDFALHGHKTFNGKILPVSISSP